MDTSQQTAAVASANEDFQKLQAAPSLPGASDVTFAATESQERVGSTTTGVTSSLYTQMIQLKATGTCSP